MRLKGPCFQARPICAAKSQWEYRNRIQLHIKDNQIGYHANQSHKLIPIDRCDVAKPEINNQISELKINLPSQKKIEIDASPKKNNNRSFKQINDEQNNKLQDWIFNELQTSEEILDLYGGNGNLTEKLVATAKHIHCVDFSVSDRQRSNTTFTQSHVLSWLTKFASISQVSQRKRIAILDPPRTGLAKDAEKISKSLADLKVTKVILVGCDPITWARDCKIFSNNKWVLKKLAFFDFFPQTIHLESVAVFYNQESTE